MEVKNILPSRLLLDTLALTNPFKKNLGQNLRTNLTNLMSALAGRSSWKDNSKGSTSKKIWALQQSGQEEMAPETGTEFTKILQRHTGMAWGERFRALMEMKMEVFSCNLKDYRSAAEMRHVWLPVTRLPLQGTVGRRVMMLVPSREKR